MIKLHVINWYLCRSDLFLQISFVRHENPVDLYDYIATIFADLSVELSQQELLACLLMGFYEEKYAKTERLYSSPLYSMRRRLNEGIIPGIKPPDGPSDDAED